MTRRDDVDFAEALRAAIRRRGLTLDRLRHHLRGRGHDLSIATLSYWQSGRSRPERTASLAALAALEEILRLEPGALADLLSTRERLPSLALDAVRDRANDDLDADFDELLARLRLRRHDGYVRTSLHERVVVGGDRVLAVRHAREVVRATRDGLDRYPVLFQEGEGGSYPRVVPVTNCALGRVVESDRRHAVAAEVLLPRPLTLGETMVVELDYVAAHPTTIETGWERSVHQRMRLLHVQLEFSGDELPLAAEQYEIVGGRESVEPLAVDGTGVVALFEDFGPGVFGVRWRWADPSDPPSRG